MICTRVQASPEVAAWICRTRSLILTEVPVCEGCGPGGHPHRCRGARVASSLPPWECPEAVFRQFLSTLTGKGKLAGQGVFSRNYWADCPRFEVGNTSSPRMFLYLIRDSSPLTKAAIRVR